MRHSNVLGLLPASGTGSAIAESYVLLNNEQQMLDKTLHHMHQNPVVAGFVDKEEDWKYSSARDFFERKGLIELSYS